MFCYLLVFNFLQMLMTNTEWMRHLNTKSLALSVEREHLPKDSTVKAFEGEIQSFAIQLFTVMLE